MKCLSRLGAQLSLFVAAVCSLFSSPSSAAAQDRVLGADISYWNCGSSSTGISQANWNTAYSTGGRVFVFLRSSRGGTTGVDQPQGTPGGGSNATLSHRYDDPRFVQNLIRATAAGMLVGPYHFARPDVTDNTGADEADHFMQMAGPWMRPGYLMPMFDQEAGSGADFLVQFANNFSDRIYAVMKIRPCIYINGNYSSIFQGASLALRNALAQPQASTPSVIGPCYPMLWNARYATTYNEQTDNPKDTYSGFYGPWDDYGDDQPWSFWQTTSTASIPGFNSVDSTVDSDVSHGDLEYVRNYLVPAVWWNDASGDWSTLANWNSGQTPVAPVTPPDQATPYATGGLPNPRLPGVAVSGPTSGQYDTVILERPSANITVTLSSGAYNIRKLYMRETLNITGGSLTINYNPAYRPDDSTTCRHAGPISAQFSGPVTLSGSGILNVDTLQVDATRTFTLNGGTLAFETIALMPDSTTPAKIALGGNVSVNAYSGSTATITNGTGAGTSGRVDLGAATRTLTVATGLDLLVKVPVINGGLVKSGSGILHLDTINTYASGSTVNAGTLDVGASGSVAGNVTNSAGILKLNSAANLSSGATLALATAPSAGAVNLNFSGAQTVTALYFGTTRKAAGTWAASGAAHNHNAFTGPGILNVTSGPASTTVVAQTSGSNPAVYGSSLTFKATVTGNLPAGTVQFKIDGVNSGSPVALVSGSASLSTSNLSIAGSPHLITAYYSGDDNNNPSDNSAAPFSQGITPIPTSCELVSSVNPSGAGSNVTFTATVSAAPPGGGIPSGNVVFRAGGTPFATNTLSTGAASTSYSLLPIGTNSIAAEYAGGGTFLGSTSFVSQVVQQLVTCAQTNALLSLVDNANGTLTLTFVGTPQAEYYVIASTNLTALVPDWFALPASTNVVTNANGLWQFVTTNATPQQFYRSRAVVPCP